jgi:hypothetical protein
MAWVTSSRPAHHVGAAASVQLADITSEKRDYRKLRLGRTPMGPRVGPLVKGRSAVRRNRTGWPGQSEA